MRCEQPRPTTPPRPRLPVRLRWGPFWQARHAWAAASVQTHLSLMPLVKVTMYPAEIARPEASSYISWLSIDPRVAPKLLSMNNRCTSDAAASSRPCAPAPALAELTDAGQARSQQAAAVRAYPHRLEHGGRSSQRGSKHAKSDSGTTVIKSVAIVLPQVFCYLKLHAGVVHWVKSSVGSMCIGSAIEKKD